MKPGLFEVVKMQNRFLVKFHKINRDFYAGFHRNSYSLIIWLIYLNSYLFLKPLIFQRQSRQVSGIHFLYQLKHVL